MSLLDWIREVIVSAGYLGLGGLVLLENLFPPLPSELSRSRASSSAPAT